jgi:predicted O-methyltransferase YrrM
MNQIHAALQFIKHLLLSRKRGHGIHSPFVYDFVKEVIDSKDQYYIFQNIESLRAKLLLTEQKIPVTDLGAGSRTTNNANRSIQSIAKSALKPKKQAQLLFRVANYFQPQKSIELGTSFGLSSLYLSQYNTKNQLYTIEGCPNIAKVAQLNFEKLKIKNIHSLIGDFSDQLPAILKKLQTVDLIYFDGNHTEEATLKYFETCIPYIHNETIFIFDDIYWSKGMTAAWKKIKADNRVKVTVDTYYYGFVFFRKEQPKEDFTVYH